MNAKEARIVAKQAGEDLEKDTIKFVVPKVLAEIRARAKEGNYSTPILVEVTRIPIVARELRKLEYAVSISGGVLDVAW
jgi:hypothetical protein